MYVTTVIARGMKSSRDFARTQQPVAAILPPRHPPRAFRFTARLLTSDQMRALMESKAAGARPGCRLVGLCDISCDREGSVEFLTEFTSIESPFYVYDCETGKHDKSLDACKKAGILFHAVDHLPSECPLEASAHFGDKLLPFVPALVRLYSAYTVLYLPIYLYTCLCVTLPALYLIYLSL